jgi:RNA polymerase sigma factor (sigma-70 family)
MSDRAASDTSPGRDYAAVADLVLGARNGDQRAWDALVERYAPLIWSICRRHRLSDTDAEDIGRSIWLHLASQLDRVGDPAALASWLITTTRRECARELHIRQGAEIAGYLPEIENIPAEQGMTAEQDLLVAERAAALREALAELSPACRQMISMLAADPPVPYAEISARLGIPVGSIGPIRARCLECVRRHPALVALDR